MKRYLTVDQGEGVKVVDRELAGLLVDSVAGDEVVVEDVGLYRLAIGHLGQGECSEIKVIVDRAGVQNERARIRGENAKHVTGRMVGAERRSPRALDQYFGRPVGAPGSRTFDEPAQSPPPEIIHHPTPSDETGPAQE